jgi:hypothetical protein
MKPQDVLPVQLVVCVLETDGELFGEARQLMEAEFGPEAEIHGPWDFDVTDYYREEMGGPVIHRWLVAFAEPVLSEQLPEIKLISNHIEDRLAVEGRRRVNLDAGYMDFNKFVLASAKFHEHKIHVGRGIYADLTLIFGSRTWRPLPWSFADFSDDRYYEALTSIRNGYRERMRGTPSPRRLTLSC